MQSTLTLEQAHVKEAARNLLAIARSYTPDADAQQLTSALYLALVHLGGPTDLAGRQLIAEVIAQEGV